MPEVATCPQCQQQLRVPDELIGKKVKCPGCGTNFTAEAAGEGMPVPGGDPGPGAFAQMEQPFKDESISQKRTAARSRLVGPGICMIVMGILSGMVNLTFVVYAILVPMPTFEQILATQPPRNHEAIKANKEVFEGFMRYLTGSAGGTTASILLIISLMMIGAGIAMLTGRMRWLALMGSWLSLLNVYCCCVACLPFGIWSLAVLFNEDVKNAFR